MDDAIMASPTGILLDGIKNALCSIFGLKELDKLTYFLEYKIS